MLRHLLTVSLLALLCLCQPGCQQELVAAISITGVDPSTNKLRAYAWRDGKLAKERFQEVSDNLENFQVRFRLNAEAEKLELIVLGLQRDAALKSHGYATSRVQASNRNLSMTIQLSDALCPNDEFCMAKPTIDDDNCAAIYTADHGVWWQITCSTLKRTLDDYQWQVPTHALHALKDLDGIGPNWVVVVGENGTALECTGNTCSQWETATQKSLRGVRSIEMHSAWMVGDGGIILRCDNGTCAERSSGTTVPLNGVMVVNPRAMRAVGDRGTVLHCNDDGCSWIDVGTTASLQAIWGNDPTQYWIVGDGGTVLKCEDRSCHKINSTTDADLKGVWGSDPSWVFVVGDKGTLLRCDESGCTVPDGVKTSNNLKGIHGSGADNVIVTGERNTTIFWDGTSWKTSGETSFRPKVIRVPKGSFTMGSPMAESGRNSDEVQHTVTLTADFWMAESEVTQRQYRNLMGSSPSFFKGDDLPVENVSWFDAVAYCNALSLKEKLQPCYQINGTTVGWADGVKCTGYRLPTEAEWEYAANPATPPRTVFAGSDTVDGVAWCGSNSGNTTYAVQTKLPNERGLYDLSGNVWELVWDWYQSDYEALSPTDPIGPSTSSYRVIRGGSWYDAASYARVAQRDYYAPSFRDYRLGFRFVRSYP